MDPIEATSLKTSNYTSPIRQVKPRKRRRNSSYFNQEVDLQKTPILFFPPGKEMLFLGIYFVTLPYLVGLIFAFFYIAKSDPETFLNLGIQSSFIMLWAIGYEVLAVLILTIIFKNAVMYTIRMSKGGKKAEVKQRARRRY
jgi:hypothetical protein